MLNNIVLVSILFFSFQHFFAMESNSAQKCKKTDQKKVLMLFEHIAEHSSEQIEKMVCHSKLLNCHNEWGMTPLMFALTTLQQKKAKRCPQIELFKVKRILSIIMAHNPDVNIQDRLGRTALMYAAMFKMVYYVKKILKVPSLKLQIIDYEKLTAYQHAKSKEKRLIPEYDYNYIYAVNDLFFDYDSYSNDRIVCTQLLRPVKNNFLRTLKSIVL